MERKITIHYSKYRNELSLRNRILRALWVVVSFFLFKPFITRLFNPWRILLLRIFGARLGANCSVASSVRVWAPWNLEMEDCTLLAHDVICYNVAKITLRTQSVVSQYSYLCAASHNIDSLRHELLALPIEIQDQAWVAVDTFIGPGVTVGQGAVVGARAAVFKDVEPWTVVGGNPARIIRKRMPADGHGLRSSEGVS